MSTYDPDRFPFGFEYSMGNNESMKRAVMRAEHYGVEHVWKQTEYPTWWLTSSMHAYARRWVNEWRARQYAQFDFDGLDKVMYEGEHDL